MRKTPLITVFLLLTSLTSGCNPGSEQSSRPVHCDVVVHGPKKLGNTGKFAGSVRFRCDAPGAEKLTIKMWIEKRDSDQWRWRSVASQTFTLRGKDTEAGVLDRLIRQIELPCTQGIYRTVVDWTRVSRGDSKGDNLVSGTTRDPCKRLFDEP